MSRLVDAHRRGPRRGRRRTIAAAIHVASSRLPSSSGAERAHDAAGAPVRDERAVVARGSKRYGPRCETTIMRVSSQIRNSRSQSSSSRVERKFRRTCSRPASPISSARGRVRAAGRRVRCAAVLDGVDEVAVHAVVDLERDAAAAPADDRPALPQPFADGEPEALAQRLLDHDVGRALERVDLHAADLLDVREQVDVGVAGARVVGELPVVEALGVVGRHRAREHELHVGNSLAHDAVRLDDADRVLPRVEPAHLHDRAGRAGDAVLLA